MNEIKINFTVWGEPKGKGRPRFARKGAYVATYTPQATHDYEKLIKFEYQQQSGYEFDENAMIEMSIVAFYKIPKSANKSKAQLMLNGEILPTKKPDVDNIIKIIADALNDVAYKDDSQIIKAMCEKRYDREPRIEVQLKKFIKGE